MKKLLYVCLDGLGDDPIPELDHRTPLEAAPTPALDALAARGRTGVVVTVGEGIAPESDIAVFAILGYDPREEHPGRGVVEAVGSDMVFRDGDLAYRVNFATCEWPAIVDRRVGRDLSSEESHALADEVNEKLSLPNASFTLAATVEHRGSLVIRADDGPLSAEVTNTDPAYRKEGIPRRGPGDVRTGRGNLRAAGGHRRRASSGRAHEPVRPRSGEDPGRLRGERWNGVVEGSSPGT